MPNNSTKLKELLNLTIEEQASDLHFSVGHPPILRISGHLVPLVKKKILTSEDLQIFVNGLMNEHQAEMFFNKKEIDFSYNFEDKARFRIAAFFQKGNISFALRLIPTKIKTIEELNLPEILHEFTKATQGFVLVRSEEHTSELQSH